MDLDEYQKKAKESAIYPSLQHPWVYPLLGLAGEAGEVADKLKKVLRDHDQKLTPELLKAIEKELGDTLWYLAVLADELGLSLEQIAQVNLAKLVSRKDRGALHGWGDER